MHHVKVCSSLLTDSKDAHDSFVHSDVVLLKGSAKRQETVIPEPDPNRNSTIPQYVFVLQCTQDVGRFVYGYMYFTLTHT